MSLNSSFFWWTKSALKVFWLSCYFFSVPEVNRFPSFDMSSFSLYIYFSISFLLSVMASMRL